MSSFDASGSEANVHRRPPPFIFPHSGQSIAFSEIYALWLPMSMYEENAETFSAIRTSVKQSEYRNNILKILLESLKRLSDISHGESRAANAANSNRIGRRRKPVEPAAEAHLQEHENDSLAHAKKQKPADKPEQHPMYGVDFRFFLEAVEQKDGPERREIEMKRLIGTATIDIDQYVRFNQSMAGIIGYRIWIVIKKPSTAVEFVLGELFSQVLKDHLELFRLRENSRIRDIVSGAQGNRRSTGSATSVSMGYTFQQQLGVHEHLAIYNRQSLSLHYDSMRGYVNCSFPFSDMLTGSDPAHACCPANPALTLNPCFAFLECPDACNIQQQTISCYFDDQKTLRFPINENVLAFDEQIVQQNNFLYTQMPHVYKHQMIARARDRYYSNVDSRLGLSESGERVIRGSELMNRPTTYYQISSHQIPVDCLHSVLQRLLSTQVLSSASNVRNNPLKSAISAAFASSRDGFTENNTPNWLRAAQPDSHAADVADSFQPKTGGQKRIFSVMVFDEDRIQDRARQNSALSYAELQQGDFHEESAPVNDDMIQEMKKSEDRDFQEMSQDDAMADVSGKMNSICLSGMQDVNTANATAGHETEYRSSFDAAERFFVEILDRAAMFGVAGRYTLINDLVAIHDFYYSYSSAYVQSIKFLYDKSCNENGGLRSKVCPVEVTLIPTPKDALPLNLRLLDDYDKDVARMAVSSSISSPSTLRDLQQKNKKFLDSLIEVEGEKLSAKDIADARLSFVQEFENKVIFGSAKAELSDVFRTIVNHYKDPKNRSHKFRLPLIDTSLSIFGTYSAWFMDALECMAVSTTHLIIFKFFMGFMSRFEGAAYKLLFNALLLGPAAVSKSFVFEVIKKLLIPDTCHTYTYSSTKAFSSNRTMEDYLWLVNEGGAIIGSKADQFLVEGLKDRLTSGRFTAVVNVTDSSSPDKRSFRLVQTDTISCMGIACNLNQGFDQALMSRFVQVTLHPRPRAGKSAAELSISTALLSNTKSKMSDFFVTWCNYVEMMHAMVEKLIYVEILPQVTTACTAALLGVVNTSAKAKNCPIPPRTMEQIIVLARQCVITTAIVKLYHCQNSVLRGKQVCIRDIAEHMPYHLCDDSSIAYFVISALSKQYINPFNDVIRKALEIIHENVKLKVGRSGDGQGDDVWYHSMDVQEDSLGMTSGTHSRPPTGNQTGSLQPNDPMRRNENMPSATGNVSSTRVNNSSSSTGHRDAGASISDTGAADALNGMDTENPVIDKSKESRVPSSRSAQAAARDEVDETYMCTGQTSFENLTNKIHAVIGHANQEIYPIPLIKRQIESLSKSEISSGPYVEKKSANGQTSFAFDDERLQESPIFKIVRGKIFFHRAFLHQEGSDELLRKIITDNIYGSNCPETDFGGPAFVIDEFRNFSHTEKYVLGAQVSFKFPMALISVKKEEGKLSSSLKISNAFYSNAMSRVIQRDTGMFDDLESDWQATSAVNNYPVTEIFEDISLFSVRTHYNKYRLAHAMSNEELNKIICARHPMVEAWKLHYTGVIEHYKKTNRPVVNFEYPSQWEEIVSAYEAKVERESLQLRLQRYIISNSSLMMMKKGGVQKQQINGKDACLRPFTSAEVRDASLKAVIARTESRSTFVESILDTLTSSSAGAAHTNVYEQFFKPRVETKSQERLEMEKEMEKTARMLPKSNIQTASLIQEVADIIDPTKNIDDELFGIELGINSCQSDPSKRILPKFNLSN